MKNPVDDGNGTLACGGMAAERMAAELRREAAGAPSLETLIKALPGLFVIMEPEEYRVLAVSDDYLQETGIRRENLLGRRIFEVFPDDPESPEADGTANLIASFERVKTQRRKDVMALQKHPIRNAENGQMEVRYWSPVNAPVLDEDGELLYLIHRSEDVTEYVLEQVESAPDRGAEPRRQEAEVVLRSLELKHLSEQLRKSEGRLQAIFRDASLGIVVTDLDGNLTDVNAAFCRMLGFREEELLAMDYLGITHPADRPSSLELVESLKRGQRREAVLDKRYVTRDGDLVWCRLAVSALRDQRGRITSLIAMVEDVTARRNAEQALQAAREDRQRLSARLFATLESMSDAFFLLDSDWRLLYLNSVAERMARTSRFPMIGRVIWEAFPSILETPLPEGFRKAVASGRSWHIQYYSELMERWLEVNAYPTSEGLAVYYRDIHEEKRLQEEIAASEQRLKYVTQATLDVAWDWDLREDRIWWSDGLERLFGHAVDENAASAAFWREHIHPDDAQQVLNFVDRVLAGNDHTAETRYRFRRRDGSYAHVEDRCFIVRDGEGRAQRVVGGMLDITERLELEERLSQADRLKSLGQLTGGVAHDFNNVLTVILGNAELLLEELAPASGLRGPAETVTRAARQGAELTRQLLAFARRQSLAPSAVDVNGLLEAMEDMLRPGTEEGITLELHADPRLQPALVDRVQLQNALLNLCINARDAMPDGGTLRIATRNIETGRDFAAQMAMDEEELAAGSYVLLEVGDTGTGIRPEVLEHVFEPFFTTKEKGKGTGLGLSTVFGFVRQSGGHIEIASEPGKGTNVRMYLPGAGWDRAESDGMGGLE